MRVVVATVATVWIGAVVLIGAPKPAVRARAAASAASTPAGDAAHYRAWVNQYCVSCHNSRTAQPSNDPVNLEAASLDDPVAHAATWERVLRKLSVRAMPPQGMPHPAEAEYAAFTTWLASSLDRVWATRATPGEYVVHRLNRTEYGNAIRDLLALDINVADLLPSDGGNYGFDNIADSLKTSPLLLERYVTAAQRISALAIGDPQIRPGTTDYSISLEVSQNGHIDGLPLGTRGGTRVRHIFPADGEYELSAHLYRTVLNGYAGVEGWDTPNQLIFLVDGEQVFSTTVGGPDDHAVSAKDPIEMVGKLDERLKTRVFVSAGPHDLEFTFLDRPFIRQDVWEVSQRDSQEVHMAGGLPRLRTVSVGGPFNARGVSNTPSRARLYVCKPASVADGSTAVTAGAEQGPRADETACAERILTTFARRAYRRPLAAADAEAPMTFYRQARADGGSFDDGIRDGVARILASPSFLYRMERDAAALAPGAAHRVSDTELASRLSFFLWSSVPDQKLMALATAGRLHDPVVLDAQVHRMLSDARADALVANFTGQWLQLRSLESRVTPDLLMFPDFDDNIRKAFRRETEMFFAHVLRNDRSTLELLNADYTFLNERLAKHYGVGGVYGSRFRLVKLTDPNRFGLLGQGSLLSLTSVATRTSPVQRGKVFLSTFLNTPPPPPPPVVPSLEESNKAATGPRTVRQQMELHRSSPVCASCHRLIDPPGFALENFNPVGQWRDKGADGAKIDAAGVLADGSKVDGPVALRAAILKHPEAFVTTVTERLLTYALGRGVEPSDMPVVRRIVKQAAANDYRLSSIVVGIVESAPFQMRTKLAPAESSHRVARAQ
jgi:mono/diheme cytochrome c family protein